MLDPTVGPITYPSPPPGYGPRAPGAPNTHDAAQSSSASGLYLDQECGYSSVVHRCFGLDVEESMDCVTCRKRTRTLRYTKFFHLVPAIALNLAMEYAEGVNTMEAAMRHIDGTDTKPCDTDVGGCGAMNGITHALAVNSIAGGGGMSNEGGGGGGGGGGAWGKPAPGVAAAAAAAAPERAPPAIFCLALAWESASAEREVIAQTLRNLSTTLDLGAVYDRLPAGVRPKYKLRCVMCYYGEHYAAFAISEASVPPAGGASGAGEKGAAGGGRGGGGGGGERWLLFDDATTKEVGDWQDVVASCEKGRLQPCVLFYQQEGAAHVA